MRRRPEFDLKETKDRLTKAFRYLRKHNRILARQNFMCCGGCASSALAQRTEKENAEKPGKWVGAVYYHHQNNDNLVENGECYIHFGALDDSGVTTEQVGQLAKEALEHFGVKVEWDGSAGTCIHIVAVPKEPLPESVEVDGVEYTKAAHVRFVKEIREAGLGDQLRHYDGRFYWHGPAVVVDDLQDAYRATSVRCQRDSMGLGHVVYPVEGM